MCVRIAYELNLHLIDAQGAAVAGEEDSIRWRGKEEKRRAWVRPYGKWTSLPAPSDEHPPQLTGRIWKPCSLSMIPTGSAIDPRGAHSWREDPIQRWKSLQDSGNQSPKAWFHGHQLHDERGSNHFHPRGVHYESDLGQNAHQGSVGPRSRRGGDDTGEDAQQQLEIARQCCQVFRPGITAAPAISVSVSRLRPSNAWADRGSPRQLHCGIYNIFVMTRSSLGLCSVIVMMYFSNRPTGADSVKRGCCSNRTKRIVRFAKSWKIRGRVSISKLLTTSSPS